MKESQREDSEVRSSLAQFCDYTTAHGLGRFGAQASPFGRALWLCFLLGTYAGFTYHMYTLGLQFASVPLSTSLSNSLPFEFPDVYFCPTDTVTMSRLASPIDSAEVLKNVSCSRDCMLRRLLFEIYSFVEDSAHSATTEALIDTLVSVEEAVLNKLQNGNLTTSTVCRMTINGEEYTGSQSVVPVYHNLYLEMQATSLLTVPQEPYMTFSSCISWNEAANELKAAGLDQSAEKILSSGFADDDSKCRQPHGLPLIDLYDNATHPASKFIGCISMSTWIDNLTCIETNASVMTVAMCEQCCYNKQLQYAGVQRYACHCSDWIPDEAEDAFPAGSDNPCVEKCPGNLDQVCGGGGDQQSGHLDSFLSVYRVIEPGSVPGLVLPFRPVLAGLNTGPYCFYRDPDGSLTASYCNIPYCQISSEFDCLRSNEAAQSDEVQLARYTGQHNTTESGEACMDWRSFRALVLSGDLKYNWDLGYATASDPRVAMLVVETSDYALRDGSPLLYNHCRAVRLVADLIIEQTHSSYLYVRKVQEFPNAACAYKKSGEAFIGLCNVKFCYETIGSQYFATVSRVGADLLLSRFGSSLGIGFTGCFVTKNACRMENFTSIVHPSYGICHRFSSKSLQFVSTDASTASEVRLTFAYFTDATDSHGRQFVSTKFLTNALSNWATDPDIRDAMRVIIVPPGQYPWSENVVTVNPGQHMNIMIRYDRTIRHSKPPDRACLTSAEPIEYYMPNWQSSVQLFNRSEEESVDLTAFRSASSWIEKTDLLRELLNGQSNGRSAIYKTMRFSAATVEDCVSEFLVRKFVRLCGCLPLFLPIRVGAFPSEIDRCFNVTSLDSVRSIGQCYQQQVYQMALHNSEARAACVPLCETRSYSVKLVAYQWPELSPLNAYELFKSHLLDWNYPNNFLGSRGLASLFALYSQSRLVNQLEASLDASLSKEIAIKDLSDNLTFAEKNLVRVTVQASSLFGQEIKEEPSYTSKNLLADLGGALGLWSGVSVLTACEVIELLFYLAIALRRKVDRRSVAENTERNPGSSATNSEATTWHKAFNF